MSIEQDDKMISISYESIIDVLQIDFSQQVNGYRASHYLSKNKCLESKHGENNNTYRKIIEKALVGDPLLLKNLDNKIISLNKASGINTTDYEQRIKTSVRKRIHSDQGDELDIEKMYQGDIDSCWTKTSRVEIDSTHKFVTLFIENGDNWSEDVYSSFWRSAIAVFLTRELERAGKNVKIIIGSCAYHSMIGCSKLLNQSITIKEYNQRISMERIAAMTHLGFFRSVSLALYCLAPYKLARGMGEILYMNKHTMPIQLRKQVSNGSTRLIHIAPVNTKNEAINELESAYKQLNSASEMN